MSREHNKGFTIIEVLAAISITAVCVALVTFSLGSVFKANERAREHMELQQNLNQATDRMRILLQSAYISPHLINKEKHPFETIDTDRSGAKYDALTFTTIAHSSYKIDAKESELAEITFFTKKEAPGPIWHLAHSTLAWGERS